MCGRTLHGRLHCSRRGNARERCSASLAHAAKSIKVGPTDREAQPDMGPVITDNTAIAWRNLSEPAKQKARKFWLMDAAAGEPRRIFSRRHDSRRSAERHDGRARRNFRPGAERDARWTISNARSRWSTAPPTATALQFSRALERRRANSSIASKPAWSASTSACPRRWLVSVHWLGRFLLRRPAHAGPRRRAIFHATKSDNTRWFAEGEGSIWSTR